MHWTEPDRCHICNRSLNDAGVCTNCEQDRRNGK